MSTIEQLEDTLGEREDHNAPVGVEMVKITSGLSSSKKFHRLDCGHPKNPQFAPRAYLQANGFRPADCLQGDDDE